MATSTPTRITGAILDLCRRVVPGGEPQFLELRVEPEALADECFENVRKKVERDGGGAQLGWRIWEWPQVLVEAEFHAVWRAPDNIFVDISPAPGRITRALFLPDPGRSYHGRQVDNVRVPLADNPLIREFIAINERIFEEMNRGWRAYEDQVRIPTAVIGPLMKRKMEIQQQLQPTKVGRNEPCLCGSGLKYKKCCGR